MFSYVHGGRRGDIVSLVPSHLTIQGFFAFPTLWWQDCLTQPAGLSLCLNTLFYVYFSRAGSHPCSPVSCFEAEFLAWLSSVAHFTSHKFSLSGSLIACIWVSMEYVFHCCHLSTIRVITLIHICPHIHTNSTPAKLTPISSQQALWLEENSGVTPCWELGLNIL